MKLRPIIETLASWTWAPLWWAADRWDRWRERRDEEVTNIIRVPQERWIQQRERVHRAEAAKVIRLGGKIGGGDAA